MSSVVRKPFRQFVPILRNSYFSSLKMERSFSCRFVQKEVKNMKLTSKVAYNIPIRTVSSSNLSKSSDKNDNNSNDKDEQYKNMLDDPDFKSILSDFAKDFDVGSDSEQDLEEIRQSLDEQESKQTSSENKNFCSLQKENESSSSLKPKFKAFSDEDSVVIPSHEELQSVGVEQVYHISQETETDTFSTLVAAKRGIHGVYDIEELVDVLKKDNMDDIAVISVPKEMHYTDYLVVATAKSPRHSKAVCERIIKLYKLKKDVEDPFVIVEGEKTSEWKAIDMGNIVLHIFLEEARTLYDIESLWVFDTAFDRGGNLKDDSMYPAIEQHMAFFNSINEMLSSKSNQKTV